MDIRADLQKPEALGHERSEDVELVETHISWVFLVGGDVYKVKRPVQLGFVDFSTVERRRAACYAEVDLNARLAPGVYLGVVPVRRGADGRARLGGDGAVVDWAVHMARLPEGRRADRLLARGELRPEDVDAVADRMARFHADTRADRTVAAFGSPEAIARNVEDNFVQTASALDAYVPEEAGDIVRWQTAFLRGRAAVFEQRVAAGRIRDGHGDLRLEHVYFDDAGAPTILDCIEFDDRFRFADVCADVAFLSMDLCAQGRTDLGERFLARYARESDDFDVYALIDFYASYRAFVRGKVDAMLAADEGVGAAVRRRAARSARRHFLLAAAAGRRPLLVPSLVAVGGVLGAGKSTLAEGIARETSAPVIDADRTRKAMLGVAPEARLLEEPWSGAYDPRTTRAVYDEVLRRADVVLSSGRPVVLDASFRSRGARRRARELAVAHGVPFRFVECRAEPSVCRARLARRDVERGVSDGRLAIFDAFVAKFEPVVELPPTEHLVVDTSRPLSDNIAALRAWLDTWPVGFVA